MHPPHCVPEIRKYYLPVGSRKKKKKKKEGWGAGGEGDIGWERTRQGEFFRH